MKKILFLSQILFFNLLIANYEDYRGQDISGSLISIGTQAQLIDTIAVGTRITSAECNGSKFTNAILTKADLSGIKGVNVDFTGIEATNANFSHAVLPGAIFKNANLTGANLSFMENRLSPYANSGITFLNTDLTNVNFTNSILYDVIFREVNFTNADLRGSKWHYSYLRPWENCIKKNTINSGGSIEKFSMTSADDSFSIRKYTPTSEGGETISVKIGNYSISGGAELTLETGAELEILIEKTLTVENGSSIIINTDADSSTSFKVNSGGGLAFENGAILEINVVSDLSAQDILQIEIMEFAENASIAGLDALVKGETILLNVNGSEWLGEWDYALENNQMLITVSVPEPAVCAAAIGALALGLALRYRNYKN